MDKRETSEEFENSTKATTDADQPQSEKKEAANGNVGAQEDEQTASESEGIKEELEAAKDKYLRLYSEFENFRKRTAREKLEMIQSANEQLITALLPVIDDFDRAAQVLPENPDKTTEGFLLIHAKLRKTLETFGVKSMEIEKGADFDADYHDAVTQIPAPEPSLKGKIVDVIEKGYFLNDKVIRYAKVVVGN